MISQFQVSVITNRTRLFRDTPSVRLFSKFISVLLSSFIISTQYRRRSGFTSIMNIAVAPQSGQIQRSSKPLHFRYHGGKERRKKLTEKEGGSGYNDLVKLIYDSRYSTNYSWTVTGGSRFITSRLR